MANDTIKLECPSCQTMLDIDKAFIGGVCRCSNCGTLMSVPRDNPDGQAGISSRPDSPSSVREESPVASSDRPQRPDSPLAKHQEPPVSKKISVEAPRKEVTSSTPPPATRPVSPPAIDRHTKEPKELKEPKEKPKEAKESKPSKELDDQPAPPEKRHLSPEAKQQIVRLSIIGGFVVLVLGMILVALITIGFWLTPDSPTYTRTQIAANIREVRGNYDPDANPFLLTKPNVLGLDIIGRSVIVLDTSSQGQWLGMAAAAIEQGVVPERKPGEPASKTSLPDLQIVFAKDGGPTAIPEKMGQLTDDQKKELRKTFNGIRQMGQAQIGAALMLAMQSDPSQVILITSQDINESRSQEIIAELGKSKSSLQFDVVYLGSIPGRLPDIVNLYHGQIVMLPVGQLADWYQRWVSQSTENK